LDTAKTEDELMKDILTACELEANDVLPELVECETLDFALPFHFNELTAEQKRQYNVARLEVCSALTSAAGIHTIAQTAYTNCSLEKEGVSKEQKAIWKEVQEASEGLATLNSLTWMAKWTEFLNVRETIRKSTIGYARGRVNFDEQIWVRIKQIPITGRTLWDDKLIDIIREFMEGQRPVLKRKRSDTFSMSRIPKYAAPR